MFFPWSHRLWRRLPSTFAGVLLAAAVGRAELEWQQPRQSVVLPVGTESHQAIFAFNNPGPSSLTIVDLKVDCDCTTAALHDNEISAGETGEIVLTLNTRGLSGRVERELIVLWRDSDKPDATIQKTALHLTADVTPWLTFTPRVLYWPVGNDPVERSLEVTLATASPAPQLRLETLPEGITARLEPTDAPRRFRLIAKPEKTDVPASWHLPLAILQNEGVVAHSQVYMLVK